MNVRILLVPDYLGALVALTPAAVPAAGSVTLRRQRRPAIEELRDL